MSNGKCEAKTKTGRTCGLPALPDSRSCHIASHRVQFSTEIRAPGRWHDRGKRIVKALVGLILALGLWELFFSNPEILHGDMDSQEPLSLPFEIVNHHYFPLHVTEKRCIVHVPYEDGTSERNQQFVRPYLTDTTTLWFEQSLAYRCPFYPKEGFKDAAIRVLVKYRPLLFLPELRAYSDFHVVKDSQGQPHWTVGNSTDERVPDFIEYPAPGDGESAAMYCDVRGIAEGESEICSFRAPRAGTLERFKARKDGSVTHLEVRVREASPALDK